MMLHRRAGISLLSLTAAFVACQEQPSPEATQQAAADTVAMALEQYDPMAFDSITWPADSAAHARGGIVFSVSCSKCHGIAGAGDGGFVMKGDTLKPPSFLAEDWQYANDRAALLQKIYVGTENNMPHWGLVGLKVRDIDAVSRYILEVMRTRGEVVRY